MFLRSAKKILVINLRYIGDTIWMRPFIRNLKLNLPEASISALINRGGEELLAFMPELSDIMVFDRRELKGRKGFVKFLRFLREVRRRHFDAAFVLSNSDRPTIIAGLSGAPTRIGFVSDSWWRRALLTEMSRWDRENNPHMIEYYLQTLTDAGLTVYDRDLTIDIPEDRMRAVLDRFPALRAEGGKSVVVHPGARTRLRQWGAENFAAVINEIAGSCRVYLIGGPYEEDVVRSILDRLRKPPDIVATDLSLLEFAALCRASDLFVGNDSAPIHLAAAAGAFVIGLYGPTLSKYCAPWTERKILFDVSTLPCRLCRQEECSHTEEQACLKVIRPEMVIEAIGEVLALDRKSSPACGVL